MLTEALELIAGAGGLAVAVGGIAQLAVRRSSDPKVRYVNGEVIIPGTHRYRERVYPDGSVRRVSATTGRLIPHPIFTVRDIREMPMREYARVRPQLLDRPIPTMDECAYCHVLKRPCACQRPKPRRPPAPPPEPAQIAESIRMLVPGRPDLQARMIKENGPPQPINAELMRLLEQTYSVPPPTVGESLRHRYR